MASVEASRQIEEVKSKLTLTEVGVIVSLILSVSSVIFTAGFIYGQVQNNTARIDKMEPKVDDASKRLERIDANVEWLVKIQAGQRDVPTDRPR